MNKTIIPIILIAVLGVGGYFIFFNDKGEGENSQKTEHVEGNDTDSTQQDEPETNPLVLEREQRLNERARPQEFVALNYQNRRNLLGEVIIEGSLTNNSELTMYKDFQLMVYFRNSDGMISDSASQIVFEQLTPGETAPFKLKEKGARKTTVTVQIVDAKAEDIPKELRSVEK